MEKSQKKEGLNIKVFLKQYDIINKFEKIEIFLFLISLSAILLRAIEIINLEAVIVVSSSILAMQYILYAYSFSEQLEKNKFALYVHFLNSYSKAIATTGILFILMNWPGYLDMLLLGIVVLFVSLIAMIYFNAKQTSKIFNNRQIKRTILILFIASILIAIPSESLVLYKVTPSI